MSSVSSRSRLLLPVLLLLAGPLHAAIFVVDTSSDAALAACTAAPGDCSLRGAITAANATTALDQIHFQIPVADAGYQAASQHWRISVGATALPVISEALVVDGYTQPGSSANTQTPVQGGLNAVLKIEIVPGSASGSQQIGLDTFSNNFSVGTITIRGLVISGFGSQIQLGGSSGHRVEGCFLGTDVSGTLAAVTTPGGRGNGVRIQGPGPYQIGGSLAAERNLLSGLSTAVNQFAGSDGLVIRGNLIGTDISGSLALGNVQDGLSFQQGSLRNAQIGGTDPTMRNVIASNRFSAITIFASAVGALNGTRIEGNFIGTSANGALLLGNGWLPGQPQPGIALQSIVNCNLVIGGPAAGQANVIADSGLQGVRNDSCRGVVAADNRYLANRGIAFDNVAGGGLFGTTPNDPGDPDETGGNRLQNHPVIETLTQTANGDVQLGYRVDTALANATYPLEVRFYRVMAGGAVARVGQASYPAPNALANIVLTGPALPLTAVAIDADGNQSEFAPVLGEALLGDGFE